MRKEIKAELVESLATQLGEYAHYYVTDTSGLNAEQTFELRAACFKQDVKMVVVKNTLFIRALEKVGKLDESIKETLVGTSAILFSNTGNAPAKLIVEFRKKTRGEKPLLKGAYVEESAYIGEGQLKTLESIKSREELIGDIIGLLQSPAKNVISALQGSAGQKVAGIVKALEERGN